VTDPIDSADPDEARPTGRFRIHLGAAAGVGKTCAMLDEGWRRFQRGTDVVVGYVETHKRPYTLEQLRDLPVIPRKRVEYRDTTWEELDLVAVLDRHPDVVLVDELAHTNVPGSGPHEKRWQDVLDILDAGIAVISTVNIQHVASLSDAVERITGVPIRERVPDWVVRRADQIELVDSSADQLRRRMVNGNIYPATQVHSALSGFFRTENLVALRELSLRFLADETEEQLLAFLLSRGHAAQGDVWDTAERILVALSGAPGSDAVIGRAARMAARMKADLLALHVVVGDTGRAARTDQLEELVHDVGGTWQSVQGDDVAATIVQTAIERQITQIVLGTSKPSRWPLTRRSVMAQVLRMASDAAIDVHVIARANGRTAAMTER
jgi:two-component system, OmpR family, sensor histidine kinase KdpD